PVFLYATTAHVPRIHADCPPLRRIHGAGCGLTPQAAMTSSVGEVLERYSASRCCADEAIQTTARALGSAAVSPHRFALYTAAQYATPGFHFRPVDDNPSLSWVEGFSWTRQHSTYLPTCFVYQSPCQGAGECVFHTVSTGLACSPTAAEAR